MSDETPGNDIECIEFEVLALIDQAALEAQRPMDDPSNRADLERTLRRALVQLASVTIH